MLKEKVERDFEDVKYIGGSAISVINETNPYKTLETLINEIKNGSSINEKVFIMERGKHLESFLIEWWEYKTSHQVLAQQGLVYDEHYPYLRGHIDGYLKKENALIEVKTTNSFCKKSYETKELKEIRPYYYDQIQYYMGLGNMEKCYFIVDFALDALYEFIIEFDKDYFAMLKEKAIKFWEEKIEN